MKRRSVVVEAPDSLKVETGEQRPPSEGELLVESVCSAISSGTELKFLKGEHTPGGGMFTGDDPIGQRKDYPFEIGYSTVGKVLDAPGAQHLRGRYVFCYVPHATSFTVERSHAVLLPEKIDPERYVFLSNMESAITIAMDGRPMIGEEVLVMGQGVVGLLLTKILSLSSPSRIVTVDPNQVRREMSLAMGADISISPDDMAPSLSKWNGFDLVFEVTGNMEALTRAASYCGYSGRLIIGSYYGDQPGHPSLGEGFHRKRIRMLTSQVSTIDPQLSGRWTIERRRKLVTELLKKTDTDGLITDRYPIDDAEKAYDLLRKGKNDHVQVIIQY